MEFRFKKSSCVAVGTFNIYVLQPPLLAQMEVLSDSSILDVQADFTQPGLKFAIDGAQWVVRPERLAVETTSPGTNCGQYVSKVLEKLCWTPIKAIGTNIVFLADKAAELELPESFRLPRPDLAPEVQRTVHVTLDRDSLLFNIQLASRHDHLELTLNVHTDLRKVALSESQESLNEAARHACDLFFEYRRIATELTSSVIHGEFVYDLANAE